MLPYVLHNIFERSQNRNAYLLLRCIQSYVALDMYASFKVHTTETIAAGQEELTKFSTLMTASCYSQFI